MYFIFSKLSCLDIWYTSSAQTPMMANFISGENTISFSGCAAQMYFSLAMGSTECVLLSVMAYDRYVAICKPLRYPVIMNKKICVRIAAGSWVTGSFTALVGTVSVAAVTVWKWCHRSFRLWDSGRPETGLCRHFQGAVNHAGDQCTSSSYASAPHLYFLCIHPL